MYGRAFHKGAHRYIGAMTQMEPVNSPAMPIARTLLGPGDPPAFTVANANGKAKAVIACDHAANAVPGVLDGLGLPQETLKRHIAYDIGAAGITAHLAELLDAPAAISGFSRLVIDINRPSDDFTSVREIYDGAIIPGNRRLSEAELNQRRDELFLPYHEALEDLLTVKKAEFGYPAVISVHTCTDFFNGEKRPWHIGVLSNRDRRMAEPVLALLEERNPDLIIGDNKPYSGIDPYGFTIEHHALPAGLPNVLFEVRQDLVGTEGGQKHYAEILADVLREVMMMNDLFRPYEGCPGNTGSGGNAKKPGSA